MTGRELIEIPHGSQAYQATVALRDAVLRQPLGMRLTQRELDRERADIHLACYEQGELVGCLVLVPQPDGLIKMRQVAVAPTMQRRGIGRALIAFAETVARQRGFRQMTLHARETAVAFYEALGYQRVGDRFEEVTVPHWRMQKSL